jgi:hypothetical protein
VRAKVVVCAALVCCLNAAAAPPATSWTTYGNGPARTGAAATAAPSLTRDFVLPLDGRVVGQVLAANGLFYAATTAGEVAAFTPDGRLRWRVDVGQLAMSCQQLDGYGVLGTGVIDQSASALYVADAFGRLHALDLATGAERDGWPVRVFSDFRRELDWGALTIADGAVYVPTAAYCDSSSLGGVFRVDTASQQVTRWIAVPNDEGGGGGPWGWGGLAYDSETDHLYAATSGAFAGGSNTGDDYTEAAGYGDSLVELEPDLSVAASSHPSDLPDRQDLDFVGSPVVVERPGCGKLVVAADKDDVVYAWRADGVAGGPLWALRLEDYDISDPLLTNLAWAPSTNSLYAVTGTAFDRIAVGGDCAPKLDWTRPLGTKTENGSPTIAGGTVWFAANGTPMLYGYDARTGERVFSAPLGGTTLEAPTIADGRLVVGTMTGLIEGFTLGAHNPDPPSWTTAVHVSKTFGVATVVDSPGRCMCTTRQFYTDDKGKTWHETTSVSSHFAAGGGHLYFWSGGRLSTLISLPRHTTASRLATTTIAAIADGTIKDVEPIPGGVAALVSSRVHGQGWDTAPRVLLVKGTTVQTVTLPNARGRPLAQKLTVAWPNLTVDATDFIANPARAAVWNTPDRAATWDTG